MTCGLMTMKVSITLVFFRAAYSERKKKKVSSSYCYIIYRWMSHEYGMEGCAKLKIKVA